MSRRIVPRAKVYPCRLCGLLITGTDNGHAKDVTGVRGAGEVRAYVAGNVHVCRINTTRQRANNIARDKRALAVTLAERGYSEVDVCRITGLSLSSVQSVLATEGPGRIAL